MRRELDRTLAATVLVCGAVLFPLVSWHVSGSRAVAREMARLEAEPQRAAQEAAQRLADRLTVRLETLREAESQRPFFHYQRFIHDPQGAYEGLSVAPSPLAQGPADPLIRGYFQVDEAFNVTLPTLDEEAANWETDPLNESPLAFKRELADAVDELRAPAPVAPQAQTLQTDAYAQNIAAGELYRDLKEGRAQESTARWKSRAPGAGAVSGEVVVRVGDLEWQTRAISGEPTLVAVRKVVTPDGPRTQGFLIAKRAAEEWIGVSKTASLPVRLLPGRANGTGEAALGLAGVDWKIACDPSALLAGARLEARRVAARFRQSFRLGALATMFAGGCLIVLVWQTDRLARQRAQFAAAAAHELRTPLAGLRMYSEMLAEGLGDPSKSADYARRIAQEAARLGRVVANVLGFSRLERGKLHVRPAPGDLGAALTESVGRQLPTLATAGVRVKMAIPPDLPVVAFDHDAVGEILQNLLDNAEKHTREAADRTVDVAAAVGPAAVTFTVADRGAGVPAGVQRRLFRPFERHDHPDAPAGLGLGLALARGLAEAQGGTLSYADRPGGGASFTVTLPR